jgi:ribosomal protein L20A (L18A)
MYREVRDTSLNGAIDKMYNEMAGKHRARRSVVQANIM